MFDLCELGLNYAASAALLAAPLAIVVGLIDLTVGRWLSPGVRGWLWLLLAVRLLVPVGIETPWGLPNPLTGAAQTAPPDLDAASSRADVWSLNGQPTPFPIAPSEPTRVDRRTEPPSAAGATRTSPARSIAILAWGIGAFAVALRAALASLAMRRRVRRASPVDCPTLRESLRSVAREVGLRRTPRMVLVPGLEAPAVLGYFRPVVCLPSETLDELSADDLRLVLLHEAMHVRRADAVWSWLLVPVMAVQWWNPLAWLTVHRFTTLRELACDEGVAARTSADEQRAYVDLLLCYATGRQLAGAAGLTFAQPRGALPRRIQAFAARPVRGRWRSVVGATLVVLLVAVGFSKAAQDRSASDEYEDPNARWSNNMRTPTPPDSAELEVREYDITAALTKLEELHPDIDCRRWLELHTAGPWVLPGDWMLPGEAYVDCGRQDNTWRLRLPRFTHARFAGVLEGFARSGSWQVIIAPRVLELSSLADLGELDWDAVIRFPEPTREDESALTVASISGSSASTTVDSTSQSFYPYIAAVLGRDEAKQLIDRLQATPRVDLKAAPKITLFNGTPATISDTSQSPFVVGVHPIRGEFATAYQPNISVLSEGFQMAVRPVVVDERRLSLSCRLESSTITSVDTVNLPFGVTVQAPTTARVRIDAHAEVGPDETLLIAPLVRDENGDATVKRAYAVSATWMADIPPDFSTAD